MDWMFYLLIFRKN